MRKLAVLFSVLLLLLLLSCKKEYSYEMTASPQQDTISVPPDPVSELPRCYACDTYTDPINLNKWSLKAEQSKACGIIDTAICTFDRTAFTFFGPSACSMDTGLVMTVYLQDVKLDRDLSNVYISKVAFYYYDRITPSYIYISSSAYPFSVYIENYNHQTKILTGKFDGFAKRVTSINATISNGRFKIKLL
jgi:hypothetical protein